MTQQTIERMAIESGLANFVEASNPAVQRFVQAMQDEFETRVIPMIEEGVRRGAAGAEFWRGVYPDGWTAERVKAEMTDYHMILNGLEGLIYHVTGGMCSKPNTDKSVIKALADDHVTELVEKAVADVLEAQADEDEVMDATRHLCREFRWPSTALDIWRLAEEHVRARGKA